MDTPSISIIVPIYNTEKYLRDCLDSILAQTFTKWECILVDDGSKDKSGNICDEYIKRDRRFKVIHKKNGGVSSARNLGIRVTIGEYLMFVDSDDTLPSDCLLLLYGDNEDFIVGGFTRYADDQQIYCPYCADSFKDERKNLFFDYAIRHRYILIDGPCGKLYRRSIVVENGIAFREELSYAEDKIFVLTFLSYCDSLKTVVNSVYNNIRREKSLSSNIYSEKGAKNVLLMLPFYKDVIIKLRLKYSNSKVISELYHDDLVGRYVFRCLSIFMNRQCVHLTYHNLQYLYELLDNDKKLSWKHLSLRNKLHILLYKLCRTRVSYVFYKIVSLFCQKNEK